MPPGSVPGSLAGRRVADPVPGCLTGALRVKSSGMDHPPPAQTLDIAAVQEFQRAFAAAREWEQFHTPKNLAMALAGEAGELLEIFQWLTPEQSAHIADTDKGKLAIEHELADVLAYVIRLADVLKIDLPQSLWHKLRLNEEKYPVALAKGNARKYSDFTPEP